jgi:NTE family protein
MIAFVLSGGASLGAIQVGQLRALYEHHIAPDLIVGTSAGAINGAYIASRPPTADTASGLAALWRGLHWFEVFPPNPVTATLGLTGHRDHLVPNSGLAALLKKHLQFEALQDAAIPFQVIATDVLSGAERRLSTGDARTAVLASAAIPGVYPAVVREGDVLVDGGVADNTPISAAAELGAGTVYVLPTGGTCQLAKAPGGAIPMLVHALTLLINQRLIRDIRACPPGPELIVLPPPCPQTVLASDFSHADQLMSQGYELAAEALDHPDPAAFATPRALAAMEP